MAPKKNSGTRNAASIAEVSAASVVGYLQNAACRTRVPRAEGGKGTRRKVGMVSSHHVPSAVAGNEEERFAEEDEKKVVASDVVPGEVNQEGVHLPDHYEHPESLGVLCHISKCEGTAENTSTTSPSGDTNFKLQDQNEEEDEWDEIVFPTIVPPTTLHATPNIQTEPSLAKSEEERDPAFTMVEWNRETTVGVKKEALESDECTLLIASDLSRTQKAFLIETSGERVEKRILCRNDSSDVHQGTSVNYSAEMKTEVCGNTSTISSSASLNDTKRDAALISFAQSSSTLLMSEPAAERKNPSVLRRTSEETQQQNGSTWHRLDDSAYDEMRYRRDQFTARRRSQRMQKVFITVTELIFLLCRGHWLWREARRPLLLRMVLRVRKRCQGSPIPIADPIPPNHREATDCSQSTEATTRSSEQHWEFPLLAAVKTSQQWVRASREASVLKPSLTPAWITTEQDGVKNHTSAAVTVLLQALNQCFRVAPLPPPPKHRVEHLEGDTTMAHEGTMDSFPPHDGHRHESPTIRAETNSVPEGKGLSDPCAAVHCNPTNTGESPVLSSFSSFSSWSVPLQKGFLRSLLHKTGRATCITLSFPYLLDHPLYMCLLFLSLAAAADVEARLVIAMKETCGLISLDVSTSTAETTKEGEQDESELLFLPQGKSSTLETLGIFSGKKRSRSGTATGKPSAYRSPGTGSPAPSRAVDQRKESRKKPTSCFWVEVWSPERACYCSVNPCRGITTLWGAPYVFAFGKGRVVDVTPRYTSCLSGSYLSFQRLGKCINYRFLWIDKISWDDTREVSDVLVEQWGPRADSKGAETLQKRQNSISTLIASSILPMNCLSQPKHQMEREERQLESLRYSETIPHTLSQLHRHPLFVIESDLSRTEGIYPKDRLHTVGSVKGHIVYKRSAVQNLRSRDGWIREGRSLIHGDNEIPYKLVPPPASRPFSAPSHFFGFWQTMPFAPQPLTADKKLPQHGNSKWYILLRHHSPPTGILHRREPNIAKVARKMQLDFRLAVVGFEHKKVQENRRGSWFPIIEGIVIREQDNTPLLRAYTRWVQLTEEQAAAKRKERALQWWKLLYQRILAMDRMRRLYCKGSSFSFPRA